MSIKVEGSGAFSIGKRNSVEWTRHYPGPSAPKQLWEGEKLSQELQTGKPEAVER